MVQGVGQVYHIILCLQGFHKDNSGLCNIYSYLGGHLSAHI